MYKANLEWIEQTWRSWLVSERGKKCVGTGRVKEHPEHIAKLFAAFCLEELGNETAAMDAIVDGPAKSLLHKPRDPLPEGCYCEPGKCMAPVIMGRQMPCRDRQKAQRKA